MSKTIIVYNDPNASIDSAVVVDGLGHFTNGEPQEFDEAAITAFRNAHATTLTKLSEAGVTYAVLALPTLAALLKQNKFLSVVEPKAGGK